ncbi:MAG TPA: LuxR C-terminal-related transcriptional regulator, partial [Polyangiaceae bacterium]|nr:LuxR C-terminal-related transcriptional regulator [Polyangiaceae bacterium]
MVFSFSSDRVREVMRAAYAVRADLGGWADGVHEALGPALDLGQGTLVGLVRFPPNSGVEIRHLASRGGAKRAHHAIVRLSALLSPTKLRASFFNGRVLGSSSGHYAEDEFARLEKRGRGLSSSDAAGWCVNDAVDHGLMVIAPSRERLRLSAQTSQVVRRLGAHVATGLRLQRLLGGPGLDDPAVEGIFDPGGAAQHAAGMARAKSVLSQLRAAVLAQERGDASSADAPESAWSAVVAGRWSLVDRFDSDGRRYVVAYRNPPGVVDPRRLTPREECVAALVAMGQSNKEIAVDLGISQSTVATLLGAALDKLGLASRTLLPLFWRDLQGRAWSVGGSKAALVALCHSHRDDPGGLSLLSPAERSVAQALLEGLSDRGIARARNSSRHTIAKQLSAIYRKLGVRSRTELASKLSVEAAHTGAPRSRALDDENDPAS